MNRDTILIIDSTTEHHFELGVCPYYIYHGLNVYSARNFVMSPNDEIKIMTEL
jgi:L-lysine 2,3-aminomutase